MRTDREGILEALTAGMLTTVEIAAALGLDPHRVARGVNMLLDEHCISHGTRRGDSWRWVIEDIGRSELARMVANRTGQPFVDPLADEVELNQRRGLGDQR